MDIIKWLLGRRGQPPGEISGDERAPDMESTIRDIDRRLIRVETKLDSQISNTTIFATIIVGIVAILVTIAIFFLGLINPRFDNLDNRVDSVDTRVGNVEATLGRLGDNIATLQDNMNGRFNVLETQNAIVLSRLSTPVAPSGGGGYGNGIGDQSPPVPTNLPTPILEVTTALQLPTPITPVRSSTDDDLSFVMVSHGGASNPLWNVAIKGMDDACALLDAECQWLSEPDYGVEQMAGWWDSALAFEPDGIGTTVPDPEVIRSGVERAAELDIPVIVFNTADPYAGTDDALPTLFYVGVNDFAGGASNARRILSEAQADDVVITGATCAIQEVGHSSLEERCAGFDSVMLQAGIPVDRLEITNDVTASAGVMRDYFAASLDINAITLLGANPSSSWNLAAQAMGLEPRQVYATTHDTSQEIYQMIEQGYLLQTIDTQPYLQGFETIMWLYLSSQYQLVPGGNIFTNSVIDQSNVDLIRQLTEQGYR